jgi:hypothetical protein
MTAISVLEGAVDRATVPCIICQSTIPLRVATAGSLHADGRQAFACRAHIKERSTWIIGWAHFEADQEELRDFVQLSEGYY